MIPSLMNIDTSNCSRARLDRLMAYFKQRNDRSTLRPTRPRRRTITSQMPRADVANASTQTEHRRAPSPVIAHLDIIENTGADTILQSQRAAPRCEATDDRDVLWGLFCECAKCAAGREKLNRFFYVPPTI
jgi:hypothetical protein